MLEAMQTPDTKPTLPPGPADVAALEHSKRLAKLDPEPARRRQSSGVLRDLAFGWAALGGPALK